jgi:DNA-binding CsgD family transcriptional regulator
LRGDFDAVIALLGASRLGGDASIEARLLRARTLLKLQRPADVLDELSADDVRGIVDADERVTAAMLRGAASARLDPARGIAELARVALDAARLRAHPSVGAEVAYLRAVAHWSAYELGEAERFAQDAERRGRDVLVVRAMQLRAFIAAARPAPTRYSDALAIFRAASRRYARCHERNVGLATIILEQIASLEQTLRSATVAGTHGGTRGRALPGGAFGPAVSSAARLRINYNDAWLFALDGDDVAAFGAMRDAEEHATTPAWRVRALAGRAAIAIVCGEPAGARLHADAAAEMAARIDWNATTDEERLACLELGEVYAHLAKPDAAADALARYDSIAAPMEVTQTLRERGRDPRLTGWYAYVVGIVHRGAGDFTAAAEALRGAVEAFGSCGYLWREAHALIDLAGTEGVRDGGAHLERAVGIIRDNFPRSFLARRLGPWTRTAVDPLVSSLTGAERDVLRHLLEGRSQREIAAASGRAYNTVRTQMQALHRKLGTSSEHQIVVACARRGIGAPSWSFAASAVGSRALDGPLGRSAAR